MQKIILTLALLASGLSLLAQIDLSSWQLQDTWQAMQVNPASQPKGITLNLPGVYNNLWVSNVTFNDLFVEENGQTVLDIDNAIQLMEERNHLRENLDIETIGIGFTLGGVGLSLGHRLRFAGIIDYPQTLPQLIWQGNAQFIGQTIEIAPTFDLTAYHELALGVSVPVGEKLRIGARAKYLAGANNASTADGANLSLTTSDDAYQLSLGGQYRVNSAGAFTYNGIDDLGLNFDFGNFSSQSFGGGNSGLAFDLGVELTLGKLQIAASAIDLGGSIDWEEDINNYTLSGTYSYEGLDFAQIIFDEETEVGSVLDSLEQAYQPTTTQEAYNTPISTQFMLGGRYELGDKVTVGLLAFGEDYRSLPTAAVVATASYEFSKLLTVGSHLGLRNQQIANLGLNAVLGLGPVRVILATDNILTAFTPKDAHLANFRLGANLRFGDKVIRRE